MKFKKPLTLLLIFIILLMAGCGSDLVQQEPQDEDYYQKGIAAINQKDWANAIESLFLLNRSKYKDASSLYQYAYAQQSYAQKDLSTAKYCINAIGVEYSGLYANDIVQLRQKVKGEYSAWAVSESQKVIEAKAKAQSKGAIIGMTQEQVRASNWGKPIKINKTTTAYGTHEQWVYDGGYLYFDDGTLTSIQN